MTRTYVIIMNKLRSIRDMDDEGGVAAEYGVLLAGVVAVVAVAAAALEAVVKSIHRFDGGDRDLWSFVFVVAHARVVDSWRRQDRNIPTDRFDDVAATTSDTTCDLIDFAIELLDELDDERRTVIVMRYIDGLPTREIAARLGKSEVATRAAVSRALGTLRDLVADHPKSADCSPAVSSVARRLIPTP